MQLTCGKHEVDLNTNILVYIHFDLALVPPLLDFININTLSSRCHKFIMK